MTECVDDNSESERAHTGARNGKWLQLNAKREAVAAAAAAAALQQIPESMIRPL